MAPRPSSESLDFDFAAFDRDVMATYARSPIALVRGAGCRVWDSAGRGYLDFAAGIATCTLGHAHPALIEAVTRQIGRLHHVSNLYYIPEQGALAAWLTARGAGERAFFCNSGAEANEAAIKLARKYGRTRLGIARPAVISALASFHGRTLAAVTATGQPRYQQDFAPLVPGFHHVPFNDFPALVAAIATLDRDERTVAAILLEPLQGEGGIRPGDPTYFAQVRALCDERGILLMFDEVQVGVGRSGTLWGHEQLGVKPDVLTLAKGLAGGLPIGAMLCRRSCDVFGPGDHGSTFGGNPLVCAAALAVLQTLEQDALIANARDRGEQLRAGLRGLAAGLHGKIAEVRGWGLIVGVELGADQPRSAAELARAAQLEGLLTVPAGPRVLRLVPPLIVSAAEVDEAVAILARVLG
ncbi:MAG: aspartate aminotransferase family protein [Nannocystis sp.]|uniref:aspartate aminotransferase family protein n=1 Tax=Nannocystis sp. TaxID=1962667 RepID=UPI002423B8A5|nr:aspartate aminotransferase family protein [Nannocystis sp.]MBK9754048.1 aspartate aminotransferase family protein [Nannocystis sp.]